MEKVCEFLAAFTIPFCSHHLLFSRWRSRCFDFCATLRRQFWAFWSFFFISFYPYDFRFSWWYVYNVMFRLREESLRIFFSFFSSSFGLIFILTKIFIVIFLILFVTIPLHLVGDSDVSVTRYLGWFVKKVRKFWWFFFAWDCYASIARFLGESVEKVRTFLTKIFIVTSFILFLRCRFELRKENVES